MARASSGPPAISVTEHTPTFAALYFNAVHLVGGARVMADGAAFTDPTQIGGAASRFIDVETAQSLTITALLKFVADAGVTSYSVFLDWYISDNGADFYSVGTTGVGDNAIATNPSGYAAAGETSWRGFTKQLVNVYGRHMALVLRHGNAAGTGGITATVGILRQS